MNKDDQEFMVAELFLFVHQSMVTGDHGENGPFVLRPVEAVSQYETELVPTQHLRTGAVPAKGRACRPLVVTVSGAQVIIRRYVV